MINKNKVEKTTNKMFYTIMLGVLIFIGICVFFLKFYTLDKTLNCTNNETIKVSIEQMLNQSSIEDQLEFKLLIKKLKTRPDLNTDKKFSTELCKVGKDKNLISLIYELKNNI